MENTFIETCSMYHPMQDVTGLVSYLDYVLENDDHENSPYTIGLRVFTKFISLDSYQVEASISKERLSDLYHQFNLPVETLLGTQLEYQTEEIKVKLLLNKIHELATKRANDTEDIKIKSGTLRNLIDYRRLATKIIGASSIIAQYTRMGPATFAIMSGKMLSILQVSESFMPNEFPCKRNHINTPYTLGTFNGILLFVDPLMDELDNRVFLGRTDKNSIGIFFGEGPVEKKVEFDHPSDKSKLTHKTTLGVIGIGKIPESKYFVIDFKIEDEHSKKEVIERLQKLRERKFLSTLKEKLILSRNGKSKVVNRKPFPRTSYNYIRLLK